MRDKRLQPTSDILIDLHTIGCRDKFFGQVTNISRTGMSVVSKQETPFQVKTIIEAKLVMNDEEIKFLSQVTWHNEDKTKFGLKIVFMERKPIIWDPYLRKLYYESFTTD